jgi:hypothetical protein
MVDGLGDPLTLDNAEPLNLRSGVPQAVPVKRSQNLSTAMTRERLFSGTFYRQVDISLKISSCFDIIGLYHIKFITGY